MGLRLLSARGAAALFVVTAASSCGFDGAGTGTAGDDGGPGDGPSADVVDATGDVSLDGAASLQHASFVAAGTYAKSTSFQAAVTLGQGPGNNVVTHSPSYTFVGGIVGATQEKP